MVEDKKEAIKFAVWICEHNKAESSDNKETVINNGRRKLVDFLKALGLEEYLDFFIGNDSLINDNCDKYERKGYVFYEDEYQDFIAPLFSGSKRKDFYKNILGRNYDCINDEDVIFVVNYLVKMLNRRGIKDDDEIKKMLIGPISLMKYPLRVLNNKIQEIVCYLDNIRELGLSGKNNSKKSNSGKNGNGKDKTLRKLYDDKKSILSKNDVFVWLQFISERIKRLWLFSEQLFLKMEECRQENINMAVMDSIRLMDKDTEEKCLIQNRVAEVEGMLYEKNNCKQLDLKQPMYKLKKELEEYHDKVEGIRAEAYKMVSEELGINVTDIKKIYEDSLLDDVKYSSSTQILREALKDIVDNAIEWSEYPTITD